MARLSNPAAFVPLSTRRVGFFPVVCVSPRTTQVSMNAFKRSLSAAPQGVIVFVDTLRELCSQFERSPGPTRWFGSIFAVEDNP
jgi:hypothetical protein